MFAAVAAKAQTFTDTTYDASGALTSSEASVIDKVIPIGSEYENSIPVLNNRFRIDSDVEKVVLVFFRTFGAKPVVLVQPDGSKLYLDNDPNDDSYHWFETDTYDMIELTNPMPGPWQALGEILPGSKVMVIADLTLIVDPIPQIIFSGETIKHTAFLKNAGKRVNFTEFRDVVALSIDFMSTNHPDHENFGLGTKNIARFLDNGEGLDEAPSDGVFTGEFDLRITNGEWQPVFSVRTPLFSRERTGEKVVLLPNPIHIDHIEDETEAGFHTIKISVDEEHLLPESLILDGTLRNPEGDAEKFSITETGNYQREITIVNSGYGIYRANMTAYATTVDGREIVVEVPEYTFVTREPVVIEEPVVIPEPSAQELEAMRQEKLAQERKALIVDILAFNLSLLFIGVIVILLIADKRKRPDSHISLQMLNSLKSLARFIPKKKAKDTSVEADSKANT